MQHLGFIQAENTLHKYNNKSLVERLAGKFYTGEIMGKELARQVALLTKVSERGLLRIVDPFAGDGRLIYWLINAISSRCLSNRITFDIHLWDCDKVALRVAVKKCSEIIKTFSLKANIVSIHCDSFAYAVSRFGTYDLVITNPPWDVLKPDTRELSQLNNSAKAKYVEILKAQDTFLKAMYPTAQPSTKLYGWGTNLARCGVEVALRLLKEDGICGIVSPSSLLADQSSSALRQWILKNYRFITVNHYPAELRLFKSVDQDSVTFVAKQGYSPQFNINLRRLLNPQITIHERIKRISTEALYSNNGIIPVKYGKSGFDIMKKLKQLPTWEDLENDSSPGIWAGRELDETGLLKKLSNKGNNPFIKGKNIKRFGLAETPKLFLKITPSNLPDSVHYKRLVWRDVSRPSQKLRMQATIIPPNWVSGNSLNVAYVRGEDESYLFALLGVVNSLVAEFQIRNTLSTSHVSLGTVRHMKVPILNDIFVNTAAKLTKMCLKWSLLFSPALEVFIAKAYGLSKEDFAAIVKAFPKLQNNEINALLSDKFWCQE